MTEFSTILRCEYFPLCSGCQIQGEIAPPPIWQSIKDFFQKNAPDLPLHLRIKEVTGWRTRAKLAVRGTSQDPQIGLFKHGTHQVIPIPTCPLHHPAINSICQKVKKSMIELKIEPYNEEKTTGLVRYFQFAVERKTRKVQLAIVVNCSTLNDTLDRWIKHLYNQGEFHSIWLNFQPAQTNRIFSDQWKHLEGEPYLWEHLGKAECAFHPATFSQAHLSLFEEVLVRIDKWVAPNLSILELYAGIGVIGFNLVEQSKEVVCVEINPFASECFQLSRFKLSQDSQRKISFKLSSSEDAVHLISGKEVVIVDPPRKGLDRKVVDALCKAEKNTQLIYLSCGPRSFQNDVEHLLAHGWKIENAEGFLFFPGTDHVEILCSLRKVN